MTAQTTFFITPTSARAGVTSTCLGMVRALEKKGLQVAFYKPVAYFKKYAIELDSSVHFISNKTAIRPPQPFDLKYAQRMISEKKMERLMEQIIEHHHTCKDMSDVVVVEGIEPVKDEAHITDINTAIARHLDAQVILVTSAGQRTPAEIDRFLEIAASGYNADQVVGHILNKVNAPPEDSAISINGPRNLEDRPIPDFNNTCRVFREKGYTLIAAIPWQSRLIAPRTIDVARFLGADTLHEGEAFRRRVTQIRVCARTVSNMVDFLTPGTLITTPMDRHDIIIAAAIATMNGVPLAGLLLTGDMLMEPRILRLCGKAMDTGLPIIISSMDTFNVAHELSNMDNKVALDDFERIELVMESISHAFDQDWLEERCQVRGKRRLSPPAFRYLISDQARKADKRIVLPEGEEPRTIQAAIYCQEHRIARCILLGKPATIYSVAETQGLKIPTGIEIIDPDSVRERYIAPMVNLRKHKGLAPDMAEAQLEDTVVLATMMLAMDEVDGLVSGAVHTTANTIRPALQLIKTRPNAKVVSSVFFMCLPDQVLVYGDCAVNPNPTAEELADIAIQSADSAETFGIEPKIAMISYSTGTSGAGEDVERVREATRIAREARPDLLLDGPLQYDAAANEGVASSKAPDSKVAGKATVFVFPDLNTGNTTYKAVQRSANVVSIGPMLQGLKKPVNDLSRGALVEDIIYTIALTAIQASQNDRQRD